MLAKRIIACLDIKDGRTVKGINFENIRDAGDPVEQGIIYSREGIDELVFLDITATNQNRKTLAGLVKNIARNINIPFTVGGGISSASDVYALLNAGADKVSVNTAAYKNKNLVNELAREFGSQCIVAAIDTKKENNHWYVYLNGGKVKTETSTFSWALELQNRGAGEILLTSMNNDGARNGFALDITGLLSAGLQVPVIASGGAGTMEHFQEVFTLAKADAALAASIFHFKEIEIKHLKNFLHTKNITIRL